MRGEGGVDAIFAMGFNAARTETLMEVLAWLVDLAKDADAEDCGHCCSCGIHFANEVADMIAHIEREVEK